MKTLLTILMALLLNCVPSYASADKDDKIVLAVERLAEASERDAHASERVAQALERILIELRQIKRRMPRP